MILSKLALYLDQQNIGTYDPISNTGNIYFHAQPTNPVNSITLYNRNPQTQEVMKGYLVQTIQFIVRNESMKEAEAKADDIFTVLHGASEKKIDDQMYLINVILENPISIGQDANENYEFSVTGAIETYKEE